MFTGIVETLGRITAIDVCDDVARLQIDAPTIAAELGLGDSIAVNGVCLTVTQIEGVAVSLDAVRETLERSALGALETGSRVHLERAMRADGRFDGHIVQGHVDAVGHVRSLEREGEDVRFAVECPPALAEQLIEKGSVTIDGVALTVVGLEKDGFDVVLIPYTLRETTLGALGPGSAVNLEADVIGKYVRRYLEQMLPGAPQPGSPTSR